MKFSLHTCKLSNSAVVVSLGARVNGTCTWRGAARHVIVHCFLSLEHRLKDPGCLSVSPHHTVHKQVISEVKCTDSICRTVKTPTMNQGGFQSYRDVTLLRRASFITTHSAAVSATVSQVGGIDICHNCRVSRVAHPWSGRRYIERLCLFRPVHTSWGNVLCDTGLE